MGAWCSWRSSDLELNGFGLTPSGQDPLDELFKNLAVQGACSRGLWVELATDDEPVIQTTLDPFDHSVLTFGSDFEGICESIDGLCVQNHSWKTFENGSTNEGSSPFFSISLVSCVAGSFREPLN